MLSIKLGGELLRSNKTGNRFAISTILYRRQQPDRLCSSRYRGNHGSRGDNACDHVQVAAANGHRLHHCWHDNWTLHSSFQPCEEPRSVEPFCRAGHNHAALCHRHGIPDCQAALCRQDINSHCACRVDRNASDSVLYCPEPWFSVLRLNISGPCTVDYSTVITIRILEDVGLIRDKSST